MQQGTPETVGGFGIGATLYSWLGAATQISQLISAVLGIVATGLAIYWYILKIKKERKDNVK